jgi:hypothetical protein
MSYTGEMMETNSSHIGGTLSNFHAELVQIIDLDHGLLDELRRLKVLSRDEIQRFEYARNKEPESKSAADLITKVSHMSQEKQNTFLVALENSQQAHVSHYIRENGKLCEEDKAKWPLIECDEADVIDENWRELVETIDTEHGLLDELFAEGGINIQHMDSIKSCKRNAEKNRTLLNILLRRSFRDYRCFVDCLRKTNQLKAEALMTSVQHSNPLHSRIHVRIRTNYSALVLLIEPRYGLLDEMLQRGCITQLQKESIEASENVYVRSRRLLDMVLNMFSESDFDKFIECLEKTEQSHVCSVLQKDGVVAGLEARIRNEHDANQDEKRIVEQFMSLINRSPDEHRQRLRAAVNELVDSLTVNGVTLTAVANTHSIRFYYFCETSEGLQHLHEVYSSHSASYDDGKSPHRSAG